MRDFHPSVSITFKKLKCAKTASLMSSIDSLVRHLATQRTLAEASAQRQGFKPFQQVVEVMQEEATLKTLAARAKGRVAEVDTSVRIEQCRALSVQGQTVRQFEDRATDLWSQAILTSPDHMMWFVLNAVTDTLPHNAKLHLWGKKPSSKCQLCPERQTLQHVLNHCSVALEKRRYNERHDDILWSLYNFISSYLQPGHQVTADLPGEHYCFPQDVATTDSRPDIVIWSDQSIILVELTIPFEPGMDATAERKQAKYANLLHAPIQLKAE